MAKRHAKGETIDLFYLNTEEDKKKKKSKKTVATKARPVKTPQKETKKRTTKNAKSNKSKSNAKAEVFDFDNEIVIGVNILPNENQKKDKPSNTKKKSVAKKSPKKGTTNSSSKTPKKSSVAKGNNNKKGKSNLAKKVSKEDKQKRKKVKIVKFIIKWITLILLLIGSVIFFLMTPLFNITQIDIIGNKKISNEQIISLSKIMIR